ncbi:hypothetical protein EDC01DRAFT_465513 [Geopyxis carbonaria]|nr:hypothetical protein EDC01DRAFT_465513 [Geopyxis carbonaria]
MWSGTWFTITRILQLLTLIPCWGLLAYFIDKYNGPESILCLFIVAILATVWALVSFVMYRNMLWTPLYFAILDLIFFGILIAGVVLMESLVRGTNCVAYNNGSWWYNNNAGWGFNTGTVTANKECMMSKAAWGLGIADIILFFISACLAWHIWHGSSVVVYHERRRGHSRW